jgi:hypothetical protein
MPYILPICVTGGVSRKGLHMMLSSFYAFLENGWLRQALLMVLHGIPRIPTGVPSNRSTFSNKGRFGKVCVHHLQSC